MIFSIAMGANYSFYVKSIAICAPAFFGYIISVLASVILLVPETLIFIALVMGNFFSMAIDVNYIELANKRNYTYCPTDIYIIKIIGWTLDNKPHSL